MKIILASQSGVRKQILDKYHIDNEVIVSNVDEDEVKDSLLSEGADPLAISKSLAEIKSVKVSNKNPDRYVLGADSVISLNKELINKPNSRDEAFSIFANLLSPCWQTIISPFSSINKPFAPKSPKSTFGA